MIGLVLVTHGQLAREFIAALEHVVGPQQQVLAICIGAEDDIEARRSDIVKAVAEVNTGEGVIVLTDMFGGTPSNLALSVMSQPGVEVIAGVNLPLLVKLASMRGSEPMAKVVAASRDAGRKYINVASALLSEGG